MMCPKGFSIQTAVVAPALCYLLGRLFVAVLSYAFPGILPLGNQFALIVFTMATLLTGECYKMYGNASTLVVFGTLNLVTGLLIGFTYFQTVTTAYACRHFQMIKGCVAIYRRFGVTFVIHTIFSTVQVALYIFVALSVKRWAMNDPVIHAYLNPGNNVSHGMGAFSVGVPIQEIPGMQLSQPAVLPQAPEQIEPSSKRNVNQQV